MKNKENKKNNEKKPAHPLKKEIKALILLLVSIILGVSFFSYNPSDHLVWSSSAKSLVYHNLFGTVGAHIAGVIFYLIGFTSFWLVFIPLIMSVTALRGKNISSTLINIIAALMLVICFSGLLNLHYPTKIEYKNEPVFIGGITGHYLAYHIKGMLNNFGGYVVLLTGFIISFMMVTHISFTWAISKAWYGIVSLFKHLEKNIRKRNERKKRARKTSQARKKMSAKPKLTIKETPIETLEKPEQGMFSFMHKSGDFPLPTIDLLTEPPVNKNEDLHRETLEVNARRLEKKLLDFGVEGEVVEIQPGPVITMYEFKPAPGVKISKVAGLADDLALTLRAPSIRIVAPIPGKAAIGIEIPNDKREMVYLKDILSSSAYRNSNNNLPLALGKDITGSPIVTDLTKMPHLLVAGATGTGKSVSINAMINSLLFKLSPDVVRLLMIDPKRIELLMYHDIPHLLHPVVTEPKDATKALRWAVKEMERRYMLLSEKGVRNIDAYNKKISKSSAPKLTDSEKTDEKTLPYIIVMIDELADLMMVSSKEVEESITRLAQMARAAGIHLIIATQRPSVDVLTGIIKANIPTRISFQVTCKVDSRTILDGMGAENLLGDGDMLFMPPGVGRTMRIHGAYVSEDEVKAVTDFLRKQGKPEFDENIMSTISDDQPTDEKEIEIDEKYDEAIEVVSRSGQASISMLQRKLKVGYNRAARMIELMETQGIVGPSDGVRPRDVYGRR